MNDGDAARSGPVRSGLVWCGPDRTGPTWCGPSLSAWPGYARPCRALLCPARAERRVRYSRPWFKPTCVGAHVRDGTYFCATRRQLSRRAVTPSPRGGRSAGPRGRSGQGLVGEPTPSRTQSSVISLGGSEGSSDLVHLPTYLPIQRVPTTRYYVYLLSARRAWCCADVR